MSIPISFAAIYSMTLLLIQLSTTFSIPPNNSSGTDASPQIDTTQWLEITPLETGILLDLRYAGKNNFVGEKMYDCPRCYLRPAVARALKEVQRELQKKGLGLKLYDCYRPQSIQWALWKKVPNPQYVADPRKGSMHNRGSAIDLTLVDKNGRELDMGTPYDYFGPEAYIDFTRFAQYVLDNRKTLQNVMISKGFRTVRTEWWHFSFTKAAYPLSDMRWPCP